MVKKLESGRRVRSRTPLRRIAQKAKEIRAAKVASKPAPVVTVPKPSVSAGHQVLLETQQKIHEARDRVADLRLQYRALLEAFAPNNPPSESAKGLRGPAELAQPADLRVAGGGRSSQNQESEGVDQC